MRSQGGGGCNFSFHGRNESRWSASPAATWAAVVQATFPYNPCSSAKLLGLMQEMTGGVFQSSDLS